VLAAGVVASALRARGLEAALERLARVLPTRAPELWASLAPPVGASELDELRRAVEPYEPPEELELLLSWADGQRHLAPSWPSMDCGPLLGASRAAAEYRNLTKEFEECPWLSLWLPIAASGWSTAAVEMTVDRPGVVLDGSFPDPQTRIIAPSLAELMEATADLAEADLAVGIDGPPERFLAWRAAREQVMETRFAGEGWEGWPYDRIIAFEPVGWPAHWRQAAGLPLESDVRHPPARPIREMLSAAARGDRYASTVEGFVTERLPVDLREDPHTIIRLDDASGAINVLVRANAPGAYWAAWLGRRVQVDACVGPDACASLAELIDEDRSREARVPAGDCALALEVRFSLQR
jgi:hypothetical protein